MDNKKFATCLNCLDGRSQLPAIQWITENCQVDYVDMITEPGMDGALNDKSFNIDALLQKIDLSMDRHGSRIICVVGHHDCAGNPVDTQTHKNHISVASQKLSVLRPSCSIIGLWISDNWTVESIAGHNGDLK